MSSSQSELKVVNPIALQESWSNLIMLHAHQQPPSHLAKLCTFIMKWVMLIHFLIC